VTVACGVAASFATAAGLSKEATLAIVAELIDQVRA
jgi:hypothetical protein